MRGAESVEEGMHAEVASTRGSLTIMLCQPMARHMHLGLVERNASERAIPNTAHPLRSAVPRRARAVLSQIRGSTGSET